MSFKGSRTHVWSFYFLKITYIIYIYSLDEMASFLWYNFILKIQKNTKF